jgi:hypothetical protein
MTAAPGPWMLRLAEVPSPATHLAVFSFIHYTFFHSKSYTIEQLLVLIPQWINQLQAK